MTKAKAEPQRWQNSVVGWDTVDPTQLLAHPGNFRRHPAKQREALRGSLNELEHPTMKPVELVARALQNSSRPGAIVFEPFLGSGTTAVAAEQTNRVCRGMEIEPKYVAVTLERLAGMGLEPRLT